MIVAGIISVIGFRIEDDMIDDMDIFRTTIEIAHLRKELVPAGPVPAAAAA